MAMKTYTLLTVKELSAKIKYDDQYIQEKLKDSVLLENIHYIHPFGKRKILYLWEPIEELLLQSVNSNLAVNTIPLAAGGVVYG
jgi:hypothetical protein